MKTRGRCSNHFRRIESLQWFYRLTDKSTPEEIQSVLQMSKKNFKKSLGILYRNKQVLLKEEGVLLRTIEEK